MVFVGFRRFFVGFRRFFRGFFRRFCLGLVGIRWPSMSSDGPSAGSGDGGVLVDFLDKDSGDWRFKWGSGLGCFGT